MVILVQLNDTNSFRHFGDFKSTRQIVGQNRYMHVRKSFLHLLSSIEEDLEAQYTKSASSYSSIGNEPPKDVDYVIIGSGIGGLSCAAMLSYYGYSVAVLESHYLPGGVAHTFEKDGFKFDAGPSLWNGMNTKPYNPLREVQLIMNTISLDTRCKLPFLSTTLDPRNRGRR
jgi:hypothetical protein